MKPIKPVSTATDATRKPRVYIGIDTETALTSSSCACPALACLTACVLGDADANIHGRAEAPAAFEALLLRALSSRMTIVANHLPYDITILLNEAPHLTPLVFEALDQGLFECTLLCEKLDDIARGQYDNKAKGRWLDLGDDRKLYGYALDEIAKVRLGITLDKSDDTWRKRYGELIDVPIATWPDAAVSYALDDARAHRAVRYAQDAAEEKDAAGAGYYVFADAPAQTRAGVALALMRVRGIRTDPVATARLVEQLEARMVRVVDDLIRIKFLRPGRVRPRAGDWVPPSKDTKRIKDRIVDVATALGVEYKRTKTGDVCMDAEAIELLDDPDLNALRSYTATDKLLGYTKILAEGFTHAIHSEPNTLVANGRISWGSDAPDGATSAKTVNLTNLPTEPGVRECYVPRAGNIFWACDYSTLELCTVAQCCLWWLKYSRLAELLNAGADLHSTLGAMILRIEYETFQTRRKAGDPLIETVRDLAKRANFGLWGGMGIDRFLSTCRDLSSELRAVGIELTREFVIFLKETWLEMYPETRDYFKIAARIEEGSGQVVQFGSLRLRGGLGFTDAANTPFSGLAADMGKESAYKIQRACFAEPDSPLFGSWMTAFIHDEHFGEGQEARCHEIAHEVRRIALDTAARWIPDVPPRASIAVMRRWRKAAKAYYVDASGNPCTHDAQDTHTGPSCGCRLRPWEDSPRFKTLLAEGKVFL